MRIRDHRFIYVLGNGFDLAAKLPTRYTDFMFFTDNWDFFYNAYNKYMKDNTEKKRARVIECPPNGKLSKEIMLQYANKGHIFNSKNLEQLNTIIKNNTWMLYFRLCEYNEPGWAGFEKEIKEALITIDRIIQNNIDIPVSDLTMHEKAISIMYNKITKNNPTLQDGEHFIIQKNQEEFVKTKKKFIECLAKELIEFSEAFRLYLCEFVEKISVTENSKTAIHTLDDLRIISLNYTHNMFKKQKIYDRYIHMIHGSDDKKNNLVLGVENDTALGSEFIRFKKFFQRIQKQTGTDYKSFFLTESTSKRKPSPINIIIFFGHSLDPVDKDFIIDILNTPLSIIYIHYCNQEDYEQKVINCVNIFGDDYVIDAVTTERIIFTNHNLFDVRNDAFKYIYNT